MRIERTLKKVGGLVIKVSNEFEDRVRAFRGGLTKAAVWGVLSRVYSYMQLDKPSTSM